MSIKKTIKDGRWWSKAWTLVDGCTPVSTGCDNCWLRQMSHRFDAELTDEQGNWLKVIRYREDRLDLPTNVKKPTVFAVWSDLFHLSIPADFIIEAFKRMEHCEQHTFLVLTKRPERIASVLYGQEGNFYLGGGDYMPNVWLGTTVENQEMADKRIPELIKCKPFNLFLSAEPMLGKIDIQKFLAAAIGENYPYEPIYAQVVCGGETGPKARPLHPEWVRSVRDQCQAAGVPFFFKGMLLDKKHTRILDVRTYDELAWSK